MIQKIRIQNLRSFKDAGFEFSPGVNLIVGPNGSGKTTILEAIALFAFGTMQSVREDFQAVSFGADVGRVEVVGEKEGRAVQAECAITVASKVFKILSNKVPASQIIGYFRAVYFNPETVNLVAGAPQVRRRELDLVIAQKKKPYVTTLLEYRRVLRQRNHLLKRIILKQAQESELEFWDHELVKLTKVVIGEREQFLLQINEEIASVHGEISQKQNGLKVVYLPSCDYSRFDEVLAANLENDLRAGLTLYGPHRDDFSFYVLSSDVILRSPKANEGSHKISLRETASRGEQRTAAVAFKIRTKEYLTDDLGSTRSDHRGADAPILIFDDVFSELDEAHREKVAAALGDSPFGPTQGQQIFISATDERVVPEGLKKKAKIIVL